MVRSLADRTFQLSRRLVERDEVRLGPHGRRERELGLLPGGEPRDRPVAGHVLVDAEEGEVLAHLAACRWPRRALHRGRAAVVGLGCKEGLGLNLKFERLLIFKLSPYLELSNLQRA